MEYNIFGFTVLRRKDVKLFTIGFWLGLLLAPSMRGSLLYFEVTRMMHEGKMRVHIQWDFLYLRALAFYVWQRRNHEKN